jgi:hypothetical protein
MSAADDVAAEDTPFGNYVQQVEDSTGVNLAQGLSPDQIDQLNADAEARQRERESAADRDDPDGDDDRRDPHATPNAVTGGYEDGQTIHDRDHWLGKAADTTGVMEGDKFVQTSSWSGGVLEDDEKPPEHVVYTDGHGKVDTVDGVAAAAWVQPDGSFAHDKLYDDPDTADETGDGPSQDRASSDGTYDDGVEDGYQDGWDDATDSFGDEDYYSS